MTARKRVTALHTGLPEAAQLTVIMLPGKENHQELNSECGHVSVVAIRNHH